MMDLDFSLDIDTETFLLKKKQEQEAIEAQIADSLRELEKQRRALEDKRSQIRLEVNRLSIEIRNEQDIKRRRALEEEKRKAEQKDLDVLNEMSKLVIDFCENLETFTKLHPYQVEDIVSAIRAYKDGLGGMLNANDMGMGKTAEAAVILYVLAKLMPEKPKVLWLTKKTLYTKGSTKKELLKWVPDLKVISPPANASKESRGFFVGMAAMAGCDVFLVNYEFVRTTPECAEIEWDIVVIDEVHKLKGGANPGGPTAIWTTIKDVCLKAKFKLMLSGTPMVNDPVEMWSYLHIFNPVSFPDVKKFRKDFNEVTNFMQSNDMVMDVTKLLQRALKGRMIRRGAAEVGLQIPPTNWERIELEHLPKQAEVYKQMSEQFFVWLDRQGDDVPLTAMAVIAQLIRLRQINLWPVIDYVDKETGTPYKLNVQESAKIDEAMDLIENIQEQVIVGATLNDSLFELQRRCKSAGLRCEVIYGDAKFDFDPEHEFQQGNIDVLCINTAVGEGLNLQRNPGYWPGGASYGILFDRWWSPGRNDQWAKRIIRQGSTIPVFIYELYIPHSVDDLLIALNNEKDAKFAGIMESNQLRPGSEWKRLLKEMLKR